MRAGFCALCWIGGPPLIVWLTATAFETAAFLRVVQ